MRSDSASQSVLYLNTLSRHSLLKRSTPYASISRLPLMLSAFSTSISTGRPCVSHPAIRVTPCPSIVWKRQIRSLSVRERSEEHTSELQSLAYLVCRLLLEKKKKTNESKNIDAVKSH